MSIPPFRTWGIKIKNEIINKKIKDRIKDKDKR
jgi:hypothetical protein